MRKFYAFFLVLLLWLPPMLHAQQWVQLGSHRFVPEQNARRALRGATDLGPAAGGRHNVLVQFERIPSTEAMRLLQQSGLTLGDYVGGSAYFATLAEGANVRAQAFRNAGLVSLIPVKAEWKLSPQLEDGRMPAHARVSDGVGRLDITFAGNVSPQEVHTKLLGLGCSEVSVSDVFASARAVANRQQLDALLALPWVLRVEPVQPPYTANNHSGRTLGRASVLNTPASLGGRGLRGRGIYVGIWDGNVVTHPDFGERVQVQEYESADGADHGTHVAGTVLGAGMQEPDGMGMAPEARAFTYNFNRGKNGLSEQEEMKQAAERFGITLTQNSYGLYLRYVCGLYKDIVYSLSDYQRDRLACDMPSLSHVFAAGNDQASCQKEVTEAYGKPGYGTSTIRAKNMLYVAAVNERGHITNFSTMGPQDDGRLFPTVAAKGERVYSLMPTGGYQPMDGTSMACPTVTGHLALLQERYRQVNSGADIRNDVLRAIVANTANDAGRKGPDYSYGYGILDAEKAAQAIENEYYVTGELANDGQAKRTIQIPDWATGVRVMLVWNDPPISKPVQWGESVLVNDLDLSLKVGGTNWLPWVLNPARDHVEDLPSRQLDRLNNIEQVTLSAAELNGAKSVDVAIAAHRVADGKQRYALTWWFERSDMRLLYPAAGDMLEPELAYAARLENPPANYHIELSYDGGVTYKRIARIASGDANPQFKVPADAPVTSEAMLRIVDEQGNFVASPGKFTIAPQPQHLQLTMSDCGYDGWSLGWDQVQEAANGYEILLGDATAGTWKSVGHTDNAGATKFDLTGDELMRDLKQAKRPLFAVAVRTANGQWGKRSAARMADLSAQLQPSANGLPIVETFQRVPSQLIRTKAGKNVRVQYVPQQVGDVPSGSNYMGLVVKDRLKDFDESDHFNSAKNADNIAELLICGVDLKETGKAVLHITGGLIPSNTRIPTTAKMRVLSGDKPLKSQYGEEVQMYKKGVDDWYFTLEEGTHEPLRIQFAGKEVNDLLAISRLAIEPVRLDPDVMIAVPKRPQDGKNLGVTPVKVRVTNKSFQSVKGIEVRGYVNGRWQTAAKVEELGGFAETDVTLSLDLSTQAAIGEVMNVTIKALLEGDVNPKDNEINGQVINMGSVIAMPRSVISNGPFGQQVIDPKETVVITKPMLFTDDGGYYGNHATQQTATLKLRPEDPSMRVRVKFVEFSTDKDEAVLGVYTATVPSTLRNNGVRLRDVLTGTMSKGPRTYVSEAADGAITFVFASRRSTNKGWVAEVDLVPAQNPLTLVSAKAQAMGTDPKGSVPVQVTLRNNWQQPQKNVSVVVWDGRREIQTWEKLDELKPGESTITLKEPIEMPFASNAAYEVYVEGDDSDGSDNALPLLASYDRYCQPGAVAERNMLALYYLSIAGQEFEPPAPTGRLQYLRPPKITLYKGDGKVDVQGERDYNRTNEDMTLSLWVDWDDDGQFAEGERTTVAIARSGNGTFKTQLEVPSTAVAGERRVRLSLTTTEESKGGPCFENGVKAGALLDFIVVVKEGNDPSRGDLRLKLVDAGKSGVKLPTDRPVTITVENRSNEPYSGKIKVRMTVDKQAPQEEEIACTVKKLGTTKLTLTNKADLSAQGEHVVKVEIEEMPAIVNQENNAAEAKVYNVIPQTAERYAVQIASATHKGRDIAMPELGKALAVRAQHSNRTIEMMVNFDRPQAARLISSVGFHLLSFYGQGALPDNGLGVVIGLDQYVVTRRPVIKPGTWQHVAVVIHDIVVDRDGSTSWAEVFVDGVKQETLTSGLNAPTFTDLKLAARFDGKIAMMRAWTALRSQDELQANRYTYLREASGKLPKDCIAEYNFDEGPRNAMAYSGEHGAEIHVEDPTLADKEDNTGLWYKLGTLIERFNFNGQVRQTDPTNAGDPYKLLFPHSTDLAHVTGSVLPVWPETNLSYNGKPIDENTQFDFSGSKTVSITAERKGLYGKDYTQTVSVVAELDKDNANQLLSLSIDKAKNAGLQTDLQPKAIAPSMVLDVPTSAGKLDDITKVCLTFTIPATAKAEAQGKELVSGDTQLDFTDPVTITVTAANGDARAYQVQLAYAQEIEWVLEKTEYTYGDKPVALTAKSSSGLPVVFITSDAQVASEAQGALRIAFPGTATISAQQAGGKHFAAAQPVEKSVHVLKRPTTIRPNVRVTFGTRSKWAYEYSNLVNASDADGFPDPMEVEAFTLKRSNGTPVAYSEWLPVGEYKLEANASRRYETNFYSVMPIDGVLVVEQGAYRVVTFHVVDEAGQPIEGAQVVAGAKTLLTDKQGVARIISQEESEVEWTATKEGYFKESGRIATPKGRDGEIRVLLRTAQLELSYSAGEHGSLAGQTTQRIASGADGEPVMALPEDGYTFSKWSDDVMDNPRTDRGVDKPVRAEAMFKRITYTLEYTIGQGGKLVSGELSQQVLPGEDGTPVEVAPASAEYYLLGWDDGQKGLTHTAKKVQGNTKVSSLFVQYRQLPDGQNFEDGWNVPGWYTESVGGLKNRFDIANKPLAKGWSLDGNYAYCSSSRLQPHGSPITTYLYSPRYTVGAGDKDMAVAFDYLFWQGSDDKFTVEFAVDGGDFEQLKELQATNDAKRVTEVLTIAKEKFAGKHDVQFRWSYKAKESNHVLIDNISMYWVEAAATQTLTYEALPSDGGTITLDGTAVTTQSVNRGSQAKPVVATPNADFKFIEWRHKDRKLGDDPTLKLGGVVSEDATYTAVFRNVQLAHLTYKAIPAEGGVFKIDEQQITEQDIKKGEDAKPVTAVPQEGYRFVRWNNTGSTDAVLNTKADTDTEFVAIFERQLNTATFAVSCQGKPVPQAQVNLGTMVGKTDDNGALSFSLEPGEYRYFIMAEGYHPFSGMVTVATQDVQIPVELLPLQAEASQAATFVVKHDGAPVAGATIEVASHKLTTDAKGSATVLLAARNTYNFTVKADGFATVSGELVLENEPKTVDVTLQRVFTVTWTTPEHGELTVSAAGKTLSSGDAVVQWSELTVEAKPEKGYKLTKLLVNGEDRTADIVRGVLNLKVAANVALEATFALVQAPEKEKEKPAPAPTEVGDAPFAQAEVFPNPFVDEVRVRGLMGAGRIRLLDAAGALILTEQFAESHDLVLQLGNLPAGVYLLVIDNGQASRTLRVVKQ